MCLIFKEEEKKLRTKVEQLNNEWCKAFPEYFVRYGFYPAYTKQKYRILFVGREAYRLAGHDYIEVFYKEYTSTLNVKHFHHRIASLAYGLLTDFKEKYSEIPSSRDIFQNRFPSGEVSFAFMNISTISNETGWTETNELKMNQSRKEGEYFRKEMIKLLAPDIIVCANLPKDIFNEIADDCEVLATSAYVDSYLLKVSGENVLCFNTYHWSARMNTDECFYAPLGEAFKKYKCRLLS